MANLQINTTDGAASQLKEAAVQSLKDGFRGKILTRDSEGYDEARAIWNAMIDRRPALIARCAGAADVMRAVGFVREHNLLFTVRGGGHNIAGNAVYDDAFMIDLSPMKSVHVNPDTRKAHVEPGATLADFDHEAQAFGLATPLGINSTTGVAGLTLGGGFGWLTRQYGMSVDNLSAADVVTADGRLVRASAQAHPDLFWALRGGGGNFGVVTGFEFDLHAVGPEIFAGLIVFPFDQAKTILTKYRDFVDTMPDELNVWAVLRKAPPLPFLPATVHGKEVVILAVFHAGDARTGERLIEPLRGFGKAHGEHFGPQPYVAWQRAFDPLLTPGMRNYWKSHNFARLNDGAVDVVIEYASKLPSPHCEMFIGLVGGRAARVAADETAYSHRDTKFVLNVHGRWEKAEEDRNGIGWARDFFKAAAPHATGGVYVNFMTEEETERIPAAYRPEVWKRLVAAKNKWDPKNLFRMNQNIKPSS
jgi:FAD/FMN-containing dehydrogenase